MAYLNPDLSEINRTIGGISSVDKMVELLKTKGGARYEGGSRSPLIARELKVLTLRVEAAPGDAGLRRQRFDLIVNEILDSLEMENFKLAGTDLNAIARLDSEVFAKMSEDRTLYSTFGYIQRQPQRADFFIERFMRMYPKSERTAKLHATLARSTMKAAQYAKCAGIHSTLVLRYS